MSNFIADKIQRSVINLKNGDKYSENVAIKMAINSKSGDKMIAKHVEKIHGSDAVDFSNELFSVVLYAFGFRLPENLK